MRNWTKHLIPNVGTLLIVGLLLLAQGAVAQQTVEQWAQPPSGFEEPTPSSPAGVRGPSSTLFSYQGQLLDANEDPVDDSVEMTFSLFHQESGGTPFWTEIYASTQAITVTNGLFHVLLGSLTPIDPADLTGDLYLELTVNGETLTPRELLTSVAYAVEAETLAAGASTRGDLNVPGAFSVDGELALGTALRSGGNPSGDPIIGTNGPALEIRPPQDDVTGSGIFIYDGNTSNHIRFRVGADARMDARQGDGSSLGLYLQPTGGLTTLGGHLDMTEHDINNVERIESIASGNLVIRNSVGGIRLASENSVSVVVDNGDEPGITGSFVVYKHSFTPSTRIFEVTESDGGDGRGVVHFWGQIDMHGHTVVNCGALVEANLQTKEEIEAGRVDRFEEGDVLCWGMDRLELCATANDRLVQAVADSHGRPIVIGAEVIKVLGPVQRGDLLVASDVPGYAMVDNDPLPGSVIAQALEDFDNEMGTIKAMIRKW